MRKYISRETILDKTGDPFGYELNLRSQRCPETWIKLLQKEGDSGNLTGSNFAFVPTPKKILLSPEVESLNAKKYILSVDVSDCHHRQVLDRINALHNLGFSFCIEGLTEVFDISKIENAVEYLKIDFLRSEITTNHQFIQAYGKKKLIAASIETDDEHLAASYFGFDYYQGYLVSNPTLHLKEGQDFNVNAVILLINELNKADPDFDQIETIINQDAGLTLRLLSRGNTMAFASKVKFSSASQVVVRMGIVHLQRWAGILLVHESANVGQDAKLQQALLRALFVESLAKRLHYSFSTDELYYIYLKGILSIFPYESQAFIFQTLSFLLDPKVIAEAECLLAFNLAYEAGDCVEMEFYMGERALSEEDVMDCYAQSIALMNEAWAAF